MAAPNTSITLGFGGGAKIDGAAVLMTGGSLSETLSVPKLEPFGMPITSASRSAVATGLGTWAYSGSVSFDWTISAVTSLVNNVFLVRNKVFDIIISDGNKTYTAADCKFGGVTVSASANSLVTGSIDFQNCGGFTVAGSVDYIFDQGTNMLVKYWQTGNTGVESFTLTISQALTPSYLNYSSGTDAQRSKPQYLRAGMWDISLDVTAFTGWLSHRSISIGPTVISIDTGLTESYGFSYGGVNETGSHNYSFKSHALANSGASFYTITPP